MGQRETLQRAFGDENAKVYVCGSNAVGQAIAELVKKAYKDYWTGKGNREVRRRGRHLVRRRQEHALRERPVHVSRPHCCPGGEFPRALACVRPLGIDEHEERVCRGAENGSVILPIYAMCLSALPAAAKGLEGTGSFKLCHCKQNRRTLIR